MSHQIQKIKSLRQGEKTLHDNVPIQFNEWNTVTAGNLSNLPKKATVKFTVLANHHSVGASNRQKETSYDRSQMGIRLDHIEDNPKSIIKTWQSIRNELMPRMADVDAVSAVELFGSHLTRAATYEFMQILFDCAAKLYVDIDPLTTLKMASVASCLSSSACSLDNGSSCVPMLIPRLGVPSKFVF